MPAQINRIFPLGESALTIDFGNEISEHLNAQALSLAGYLDANRFPGFIEVMPAYASVSVFYNLIEVRKNFPEHATAFAAARELVERAVENSREKPPSDARIIEIPVDFNDAHAIDLRFVAESNSLKRDEVIRIFTSSVYRVYMLGFLPGFAYMGEVDERIATPRKDSPRLKVPKGSLGIAGRQTGIYPLESPGGWQIIGKTEIDLFTPDKNIPCVLQPGDRVKFYDSSIQQ